MPVEWGSGRRRARWQPVLADGKRMWREPALPHAPARWRFRGTSDDIPALYSKRRAERHERKKVRRLHRQPGRVYGVKQFFVRRGRTVI